MTLNRYHRDKVAEALRKRVRDTLIVAMTEENLSMDDLATRVGRPTTQVMRWLCDAPHHNFTLDIAAELLAAINGGEFDVRVMP